MNIHTLEICFCSGGASVLGEGDIKERKRLLETEEQKSGRNRRSRGKAKTGYLKDCSGLRRQRLIQASNRVKTV